MGQLTLTPTRILEYRDINFGTAHASGRALGDDGRYYVVKKNGIEDQICATEHFCHSIAESLNLPILQFKPLQFPDGQLVFGSALREPVLPEIEASRLLIGGATNEITLEEAEGVLSATFAFDLVMANFDRHEANFLLTPNSLGVAGTTQRID